jgi:hypothetical protein
MLNSAVHILPGEKIPESKLKNEGASPLKCFVYSFSIVLGHYGMGTHVVGHFLSLPVTCLSASQICKLVLFSSGTPVYTFADFDFLYPV